MFKKKKTRYTFANPSAARPRFRASIEFVMFLTSAFWAITANWGFYTAALKGRDITSMSAISFAVLLFVMILGLHMLLAVVTNRWTVKPILGLLLIAGASASFYTSAFGIYLDPSMIRNVFRTDIAEARELLSWRFAVHMLLFAGIPLLLLWRVHIVHRPLARAVLVRIGFLLLGLLLAAGSIFASFQQFSSLMRNQKELRYLITPANLLWSVGNVIATDAKSAAKPRQAIGLDAKFGAVAAQRTKPMIVVLVVGETVRGQNWGLNNGYLSNPVRQTTPQLAGLDVINFSQVKSCGTNTEVSLPCMFAPIGRRDYNEATIRGSESLLHVVNRAGVAVQWRDNQSGCKGVCEGLPTEFVKPVDAPDFCDSDRCLDEGLLVGLDARIKALKIRGNASQVGNQPPAAGVQPPATQLLVLHQLGNHGPSYYKRYPKAFSQFVPECRSDDLHRCSIQEITNAYDNAILYTDHILAKLIAQLKSHEIEVDSAVIYVSDHGESLGENGLFLHGIPYAIAPAVQTHVPMVMWASSGLSTATATDMACVKAKGKESIAHDHLFHTLLGLLDVATALYDKNYDVGASCRSAVTAK